MAEAKVISCRQCGKKLKIPPEAIGKNVKCSNCAYRMLISPTFFAGLDDGQLKPIADSESSWQKEIAMTSPLGFDDDEYKRTYQSVDDDKASGKDSFITHVFPANDEKDANK